ncbi:hypothetical protein MSPP1_002934 [Malassezia sp. CBS 17886]|nr:hypothetical protein MSPP1_002934 [Malassezia sp. CBS 17886]
MRWSELATWDTTDNTLQVLRFVFLYLYARFRVPPPRTAASALMHPVAFVASRTMPRRRRRAASKCFMVSSEALANVRRLAILAHITRAGGSYVRGRLFTKDSTEDAPERTARLAALADVVGYAGEACDVLAFLTGTGLFWQALGFTRRTRHSWTAVRQRQGLERVGVYVSLVAILLQIVVVRRRRAESYAALDGAALHLEKEDYHFLQRRLRWLRIERVCLWGDLGFTAFEAAAATADKELFEASTGLFASIMRLARILSEHHNGPLDI